MNYNEEFDKLKTKVLKYVLYKKRTESEIRQKFADESSDMIDEIIEFLKQEKYIDDNVYIKKAVNEYKKIKNLSIKELKYKLLTKGIKNSDIDDYIMNNKEDLLEYEIQSARNIFLKKQNQLEESEIEQNLLKKGYLKETIKVLKN